MMKWSIKILPLILILTAQAAILAEPEEVGRIEIEVGNFAFPSAIRGPKTDWVYRDIERFEQQHPDVLVKTLGLFEPNRYWRPIETLPALAQNVISIHSHVGGEIPYLVQKDLLVPLDDFLSQNQILNTSVPEGIWDPVTYNGKIYAFPWVANMVVLLVNKKMLASTEYDSPPKTWDEALEIARVMKELPLDSGIHNHDGLVLPVTDLFPFIWESLITQQGEHFFYRDRYHFETPAVNDAYRFLKTIVFSPYVRSQGPSLGWNPSPYVGMELTALSRASMIQHLDDYHVALPPIHGLNVFPNHGFYYLAIRRGSEAEENASWDFIQSLCVRGPWLMAEVESIPERNKELLYQHPVLPIQSDIAKSLIQHDDLEEVLSGLNRIAFSGHHTPKKMVAREAIHDLLKQMLEEDLDYDKTVDHMQSDTVRAFESGQEFFMKPYALYH